MGEVQDELDRALLEDGTARVTEGMVFRDAYQAMLAARMDPAQSYFATVSLPRLLLEGYGMIRATPARPLRLRVHLDPVDGPIWLGLLAQCAWLRGGIICAALN